MNEDLRPEQVTAAISRQNHVVMESVALAPLVLKRLHACARLS